MQFPNPRAIVKRWLAASPLREVSVHSPLPVSECARRLSDATTPRRASDYFIPRIPRQTGPHFQGSVGVKGRVQLARYSEARRGSFPAWLDARLESANDGGAVLTGTIGESPRAARSRPFVFGGAIAVNVGIVVAGAVLLVVVPSSARVAVLLIVIGLGYLGWLEAFNRIMERRRGRNSELLLEDVRAVLNSGEQR
jgi:hypothetical protein